MKRKISAIIMLLMLLTLAACGGGGDSSPPTITTQILSNPTIDGDIERTPTADIVTQGMSPTVQSVFAGIDPASGTESRAFLNFPLTGAGGVPGNAVIVSAFLDIFIIDIRTASTTIPIRIDLVDFQPPDLGTLLFDPFDRLSLPALASISTTILLSDLNQHVSLNVTALMQEAQRLGLLDFQIRILEELGPVTPGLIEIDDTTVPVDRPNFAPLLEVTYF